MSFLAVMALLWTACEPQKTMVPKENPPVLKVWLQPDGSIEAEVTQEEALEPKLREQLRRYGPGSDPDTWPEPMRRAREMFERGEPAYALVPGELPGGALAQIERDSNADYPRLIILSDRHLDPDVLVQARAALFRDEMEVPDAPQRRVLTLTPQGNIRVQVGSRAVAPDRPLEIKQFGSKKPRIDKLLARLRTAAQRELPGLGAARVVAP